MPKKHYLTIAAAALLSLSGLSSAFAGTETAAPADKTVATPCPVTYITGGLRSHVRQRVRLSRPRIPGQRGNRPALTSTSTLHCTRVAASSAACPLSSASGLTSAPIRTVSSLHIGVPLGAANGHATKFSTVPSWYEFDWDPGLSVTFAKNFTLLVQYFEFDSPSGSFGTARSIDANLTYNDSGLLGRLRAPSALHRAV